jgi:hypothetical protein
MMKLKKWFEEGISMIENNIKNLYRIGGISALLQLAAILTTIVIMAVFGPRLTSAAEFFTIQQGNPLAALLRGDHLAGHAARW